MPLRFVLKPFAELTLTELYDLLRLRSEVFVVEQHCPYQDVDGRDPASLHLLGYAEGGELAAYARLLPAGVSYPEASLGRVLTAPRYRGRGLGRALLAEALAGCAARFGPGPLRIGAQQYLRAFYESFGFVAEGAGYLEDGIPHLHMVRQAG